jgi:hypothetical protein
LGRGEVVSRVSRACRVDGVLERGAMGVTRSSEGVLDEIVDLDRVREGEHHREKYITALLTSRRSVRHQTFFADAGSSADSTKKFRMS